MNESSATRGATSPAGARRTGQDPGQPGSYRPYDFRRANLNPKAQVSAMVSLMEDFSSVAGAAVSAYLRLPVQLAGVSVEAVPYEEFLRVLPKHAVTHLLGVEPLPGSAMLEIEGGVSLVMLERMLGGAGEKDTRPRKLTDVEGSLISKVAEKFLSSLGQSWGDLMPVQPRLREVVWDPQFLQLAIPGDVVVVATYIATIGGATGNVRFVAPRSMLEPVSAKLAERNKSGANSDARQGGYRALMLRSLNTARLGVRVELGAATL